MAACNRELKESGAVAMPRTCARCGLGPCRPEPQFATDLKALDAHVIKPQEYEDAPELTDKQLAEAVVKNGNAIDANDAYPWSKGDTQILLRSFVFEQLSTPQSTLDSKKEIPAMQAYCDWIMTGSVGSAPTPSPSKLKVV